MKQNTQMIAAVGAALLLGACTDRTGDENESNNILETQQQALERARDVEQDVAEAARRQAEEIERSEGDG